MKYIQKVMLVDDDPINNFINKKKIEQVSSDIEVKVFEFAEEAIEALKEDKSKFDLIFLDINMPDLSGWEFLDIVQNLIYKPTITILTSSINLEDMEQAEKHPLISGYMVKPIDKTQLEVFLRKKLSPEQI